MRPREFENHPVSFASAMARGLWRGIGKGAHDGDTILVFADKGMFDYQMVTLRLLGINTAEIVGTTGDVLELARRALARTEGLTLNQPLLFRTTLNRTGGERMSFDRYLADVRVFHPEAGELDLVTLLLAEGLG